MRIAIVTDAWAPQISGVVRTYEQTVKTLQSFGHVVKVIHPNDFKTIPCPTYPTIPLAVWPGPGVKAALGEFEPDAIHIATEGPLGHAARRWCRREKLRFTTSFHTQFPEYIRARVPFPIAWSYTYLRRFHSKAECVMVPTRSQAARLGEHGFERLNVWGRGVDTGVFSPENAAVLDTTGPVMIYMGRIAVEKNLEAFLELDVSGSKVLIGDGPDRERLAAKYPRARFLGAKSGRDLARHVAAGDVFVFPSLTDTFGVVLLEAMACGLPVAAYPVTGPIDVVESGRTGVLDHDLGRAVEGALALDPQVCIEFARTRTWEACTETFASYLVPART